MHRYLLLFVFLFAACAGVPELVEPTSTSPNPVIVSADMELVAQGLELAFNDAMYDMDWECMSKITTEPDIPVAIYCDAISYDDHVQFTSLILPKRIGSHSTIVRGFEKTTLGQAIVLECIIIEKRVCNKDRMTIPEALVYLLELWQTYNDMAEEL